MYIRIHKRKAQTCTCTRRRAHTCSSLENNYNHSTTISLIDMARGHVAGNSTLSPPQPPHLYKYMFIASTSLYILQIIIKRTKYYAVLLSVVELPSSITILSRSHRRCIYVYIPYVLCLGSFIHYNGYGTLRTCLCWAAIYCELCGCCAQLIS